MHRPLSLIACLRSRAAWGIAPRPPARAHPRLASSQLVTLLLALPACQSAYPPLSPSLDSLDAHTTHPPNTTDFAPVVAHSHMQRARAPRHGAAARSGVRRTKRGQTVGLAGLLPVKSPASLVPRCEGGGGRCALIADHPDSRGQAGPPARSTRVLALRRRPQLRAARGHSAGGSGTARPPPAVRLPRRRATAQLRRLLAR